MLAPNIHIENKITKHKISEHMALEVEKFLFTSFLWTNKLIDTV